MRRRFLKGAVAAVAVLSMVTACSTDDSHRRPRAERARRAVPGRVQDEWFVQADYDTQTSSAAPPSKATRRSRTCSTSTAR